LPIRRGLDAPITLSPLSVFHSPPRSDFRLSQAGTSRFSLSMPNGRYPAHALGRSRSMQSFSPRPPERTPLTPLADSPCVSYGTTYFLSWILLFGTSCGTGKVAAPQACGPPYGVECPSVPHGEQTSFVPLSLKSFLPVEQPAPPLRRRSPPPYRVLRLANPAPGHGLRVRPVPSGPTLPPLSRPALSPPLTWPTFVELLLCDPTTETPVVMVRVGVILFFCC